MRSVIHNRSRRLLCLLLNLRIRLLLHGRWRHRHRCWCRYRCRSRSRGWGRSGDRGGGCGRHFLDRLGRWRCRGRCRRRLIRERWHCTAHRLGHDTGEKL